MMAVRDRVRARHGDFPIGSDQIAATNDSIIVGRRTLF